MSQRLDQTHRSAVPALQPTGPRQVQARQLVHFLFVFACLYALLAILWARGFSTLLIDCATVKPAAWLARQILADPRIFADGSRIRSELGTINVLAGCEGTDALLLLSAGILVYRARWRERIGGIIAGAALVFLLNQGRILVLFASLRAGNGWFGPLHGFIAPLALVSLALCYFLFWARWADARR